MRATKVIIPDETGGRDWELLAHWPACVLLIAVVVGLISMLIPQLIQQHPRCHGTLPSSINNLEIWLEKVLNNRIWSSR